MRVHFGFQSVGARSAAPPGDALKSIRPGDRMRGGRWVPALPTGGSAQTSVGVWGSVKRMRNLPQLTPRRAVPARQSAGKPADSQTLAAPIYGGQWSSIEPAAAGGCRHCRPGGSKWQSALPTGDRQPRPLRQLVQASAHRPQQVEQIQLRIVQQRQRLARPGEPEQPLEPHPVFRPHRVERPRRLSLRRLHRADALPLRPLPEAESRVKVQHRIVGEQVYVLGQARKHLPHQPSCQTSPPKIRIAHHRAQLA